MGANLQQGFGVPAAAPDICSQTQPALSRKAGIDGDGLGVPLRHCCLSLATPGIESFTPLLRRVVLLCYRSTRMSSPKMRPLGLGL